MFCAECFDQVVQNEHTVRSCSCLYVLTSRCREPIYLALQRDHEMRCMEACRQHSPPVLHAVTSDN
jgi:hypothetical protein